jgi:hypothetical protein
MSEATRPGANGMTSSVMTVARNTTTGAIVNTGTSAPVGVKSSFMRTLRPWKTGTAACPWGPMRLGPMRRFIWR